MSRITDKQILDWMAENVWILEQDGDEWFMNHDEVNPDIEGYDTPRAAIKAAIKAERQSARKVGGGK